MRYRISMSFSKGAISSICLFTVSMIAGFASVGAAAAEQDGAEPESPWLLAPTLTSDPKLGTSLGGIVGYLWRFDPDSVQSMVGATGSYSDTDSHVVGLFADLYLDGNRHKLKAAAFGGRIRNEYDDFLGTGQPAKTEDDLKAFAIRYAHRIVDHWYLGAQAVSTNYTIGIDGLLGDIASQVGLTGFDSTGIGLTLEFDDRDNIRNPTQGHRFFANNIAYREGLGGDESFDVYRADYTAYIPAWQQSVLGIQVKGRWTDDAPLAGYSSVELRGYTFGNYLDEHYSHVDFDLRVPLRKKWGLVAFTGIGCLYPAGSDCGNGDNLYPSVGAGISYVLKPKAGIVVRAEFAKGDADNSAFYLRMGNPFR